MFPQLLVKNLQFEDGKMIPASKYFSSGEESRVELTDDELKVAEEIRVSFLQEKTQSSSLQRLSTHAPLLWLRTSGSASSAMSPSSRTTQTFSSRELHPWTWSGEDVLSRDVWSGAEGLGLCPGWWRR